jgi:hypothetical protein
MKNFFPKIMLRSIKWCLLFKELYQSDCSKMKRLLCLMTSIYPFKGYACEIMLFYSRIYCGKQATANNYSWYATDHGIKRAMATGPGKGSRAISEDNNRIQIQLFVPVLFFRFLGRNQRQTPWTVWEK